MIKAYKYCLLPDEKQAERLNRWFGMCRFIYNLGLEVKIASWAAAKKNVSSFALMRQMTELKRSECPWLEDAPRLSLEAVLNNLGVAYDRFFKGSGFPKFKKRNGRQSIMFRQSLSVNANFIRLPKLGLVPFVNHRPLGEGKIKQAIVSKTPTGKYFVSILIENSETKPYKKAVVSETAVGVDVGLKTFATLSNGEVYQNPKYLQHQLKRLRVEQRKLNRRFQKGKKSEDQSKGWHKQKLVVAKIHEKITNQRKDFLHKTSSDIIKNHDTVCLEDLNVKGMLQNNSLSKAISDVGWNEFNRQLQYKADWYGKNIKYIGRFDPSSKICSNCGNIFKELKLSDREWDCKKCGTEHDRDENAAKNIKNFGLRAKPSTANESH